LKGHEKKSSMVGRMTKYSFLKIDTKTKPFVRVKIQNYYYLLALFATVDRS
jgi:hypothetical protein